LSGEFACLSLLYSAGLPVVVGRPFCVYGPGENPKWALVEVSRYLRWHLNSLPIKIIGDIDQKTRDFVHVRDVVAALLLIADKAEAGEIFNVGSGEEVSMRQLTQIIGIATGRKPLIRAIPEIMADTYQLVGDIRKLRSIGYTPRQNLLDGIREIAVQLGESELPSGATIFKRGQQGELTTVDGSAQSEGSHVPARIGKVRNRSR
jgi:nucleoside-diphosphate-sugar epimerase